MNIYFCFLAGDNSKQEDPCIKRRKKRQLGESFRPAAPPDCQIGPGGTQTCDQAITNRNFDYAAALAAVQTEEYLDDCDFGDYKRRKRNISIKPDEGKGLFSKRLHWHRR